MREIIEGLGESQRTPPPIDIEPSAATNGVSAAGVDIPELKPCILCLPARTEADEIAGMMLAQVFKAEDWTVHSVAITAQASEIVDFVEKHEAAVICISAMAPAAVMHARHLFNRLRRDFPTVKILIGLWDAQGDLTKAKNRIGSGAAADVVATLTDAQEHLRQLVPSIVPRSESNVQPNSSPRVMETACP